MLPAYCLPPSAEGVQANVEQDDDRIRFEPGAVRQMSKKQALIRFGAGAGASLVAALVSQFAGSGPAGPLLALPAILIASRLPNMLLTQWAKAGDLRKVRWGNVFISLIGIGLIATKRGGMKYALPFGTFLAIGAAFAAVLGPGLLDGYLGQF